MNSSIYNVVMYLFSPLWLLITLVQAYRRKGGWRFTSTRMGWNQHATIARERLADTHKTQKSSGSCGFADTGTLWFHAASVGEVIAVLPLLKHIRHSWPNLPIHVTCTTPESFAILQNTAVKGLSHEYFPIDFKCSINRLFRRLKPLALVIVETEIWPNTLCTANNYKVPVVIINGRLSTKTLHAPNFVLAIYRQVLPYITLVLSRSETDSVNFKKLGVDEARIKTIGNIKTYAGNNKKYTPLPELSDKRYVLAASTHAPEEQQLGEAFSNLGILLVIAPRHVQRSHAIKKMLQASNIDFAIRTLDDPITSSTQVYLADTTGEMASLIANAVVVFVGGSLVDCGGHNVLEPAAQGKPVFTGPHTDNFIAEMELLANHNAVRIVSTADELATICKQLLTQPSLVAEMGDSAMQAVNSSEHIFEHYTAEIDRLIGEWQL